MKLKIFGAEKVRFNIRDKESGKEKSVDSCRCCIATYGDSGECVSFEAVKTTADFADWADKNVGKSFDGTPMYDKYGRLIFIHGA